MLCHKSTNYEKLKQVNVKNDVFLAFANIWFRLRDKIIITYHVSYCFPFIMGEGSYV